MFTHVIVHYAEIGTKGLNRPFFERKLMENIKRSLPGQYDKVQKLYGGILITLKKRHSAEKVKEGLSKVFGICHFSFAMCTKNDMKDIGKKVAVIAKKSKAKTFRITAHRSNKQFPLTSRQINEQMGGVVLRVKRMKVKLVEPELEIFVEITEKYALVYSEKLEGPGGLPVGTSGVAVSLLSGGIDSPVASYMMMKRGCRVVFAHFFMQGREAKTKIGKLVERLDEYQHNSVLYLIPFKDLQAEIIKRVPAEYRMIVYRRMMFRIAGVILEKEKAGAFVTGDNLAQVASQTMENLRVIYEPIKHPILSPLMGFDKNEIIKVAEKIGTYKISIMPYDDCCSFFVAQHPKTRGRVEDARRFEKKLKVKALINNAIKKADIIKLR